MITKEAQFPPLNLNATPERRQTPILTVSNARLSVVDRFFWSLVLLSKPNGPTSVCRSQLTITREYGVIGGKFYCANGGIRSVDAGFFHVATAWYLFTRN